MEPYKIIKNPLSTEKSIKLMEAENKLIFAVDEKAKKNEIKDAIEKIFKVKVIGVNTFTNPKGQKRAYVKLSPETPAIDIATEIGMM
ncbi:50S ribosomal protein L23 [Candidatus Woesearchaeota archaeon]|nr:50S ribosomal protein L23 [Candidatus Woesearchaeota archaeon]